MAHKTDFRRNQKVDNFILEEPLGAGQDGEVWRATRATIGKPCAIKFLKTVNDLEGKARFEREIKILASLDHPYIVQVQDKGEAWNPVTGEIVPYYVMEFLPGKAINKALHEMAKELRLDSFCVLFRQILSALEDAHASGVSHGDIKPANILVLSKERVAKLSDFGFGLLLGESKEPRTQYPGSSYKAPPGLTPAQADIYRLGRTLADCLDCLPESDGIYASRKISALATRMSEQPASSTLSEAKEILEGIRASDSQTSNVSPESPSEAVPELSHSTTHGRPIFDPIHGVQNISQRTINVLDLDAFQKLRRIKHFSSSDLVYPSLTISAFEVALGEHAMLIQQLDWLMRTTNLRDLVESTQLNAAILGGLLLSGARIPFQPQLARALSHKGLWLWERATELALSSQIADLTRDEWKIEPEIVGELLQAQAQGHVHAPTPTTVGWDLMSSLLHGPFAPSGIEWVLRGTARAGFESGVNLRDVLSALTISPERGEIVIRESRLRAVEAFYLTKIQAVERILYHASVRSADLMLEYSFELLEEGGLDFRVLAGMNDYEFFNACVTEAKKQKQERVADLLSRYGKRILHKRFVTISLERLEHNRAYIEFDSPIRLATRIEEELMHRTRVSWEPGSLLLDIPRLRYQPGVFVLSNNADLKRASDVSPSFAALEEWPRTQNLAVFVTPELRDQLAPRVSEAEVRLVIEETILRDMGDEELV